MEPDVVPHLDWHVSRWSSGPEQKRPVLDVQQNGYEDQRIMYKIIVYCKRAVKPFNEAAWKRSMQWEQELDKI